MDSDETIDRPVGTPGDAPLERSIDLLERAQRGDATALETLLTRYRPRLQRWARGRLPPWARRGHDTEDLVQDALLQALSHLGAFRPRHDGALQAYLRQAVHHRILDLIKQARRRPVGEDPSLEPADPAPSPLEQALGADALQRYEAALAALREEDREAIVLRVELHCDYTQIAGALGKPSADAARMSVGRALVRLAEEMDRRDRSRS